MPKFLDALAGFGVTFSSMFKRPITEQYPEEPGPTAPRYHGRHQLNRYPDGLEKCIGCEPVSYTHLTLPTIYSV